MTVTVTSALAGPATARYSNIYGALVDLGVLSGLGAQDVTGSGDPVAPILNAAGFYGPTTHSLILTRGAGDPTYSRATSAWEFDNEGKLILVPSGAARFGGARMVRNAVDKSRDISNAYWTKSGLNILSTTEVGPDGSATAVKLEGTNASANYFISTQQLGVPGNEVLFGFSAKAGTATVIGIGNNSAGNGLAYFDLSSVSATNVSGNNATITSLGNGWYACTVLQTIATSSTMLVLYEGSAYIGPFKTGNFTITDIFVDVVTGRSDKTPAEKIITGVLSAPYHGAGVDGVKWFETNKDGSAIAASSLLGYHAEGAGTNSLLWSRDLRVGATPTTQSIFWLTLQDSGQAELVSNGTFDSDTSGWSAVVATLSVVSGALRVTKTNTNGQARTSISTTIGKTYTIQATLVEKTTSSTTYINIGSSAGNAEISRIMFSAGQTLSASFTAVGTTTYITLYSANSTGEYEDWDNISVKEAAIQVTTCTGIDNAANSASTITAGAADATILQTLTLAAAARSSSAYVKRRTGSGNIYFTRDGGTSWTDITASVGASWTRVKIENTSVLNPSVGFKIATSGDAIDVDCVQDEAGASISSPIITTTAAVTRNADAETFQTASNWSDTAGWVLATVQGESWANATGTAIGNGTNGLKLSASNSGIVAYDGTNTVNGPAGAPSGAEKLAMTWGSGALQAASGGVAGSAGSYDGAWGLATVGIGTSQGNVYIKDVYIGQSALTAAQLAQVTA